MAVSADDLSAPLGQKPARKQRRFRLPFSGTQAAATALGLLVLGFAGVAIFHKDPLGGEPVARVAIKPPETAAAQKPAATPPVEVKHGTPDAMKTADAPGRGSTFYSTPAISANLVRAPRPIPPPTS